MARSNYTAVIVALNVTVTAERYDASLPVLFAEDEAKITGKIREAIADLEREGWAPIHSLSFQSMVAEGRIKFGQPRPVLFGGTFGRSPGWPASLAGLFLGFFLASVRQAQLHCESAAIELRREARSAVSSAPGISSA